MTFDPITPIVVQHDLQTGRYHAAVYRMAPLPGPGPHPVTRFRSHGHHTPGNDTLPEAQVTAAEMAREYGVPVPDDGGFPVVDVETVGAHVLFVSEP